ncbi:MAG: CBS domain-containing protein [Gemmatimonadota bacterium]|nr:CBS domain-containing protein [Gemmatimonadota bacterium]MDH5759039.1 CBS domain-containing protein [Gemmatimonadota bacterium]
MLVRDIMTRSPEVARPTDAIVTVARLMRDYDVGLIPIVTDLESLELMGVVTDRDLTIRVLAEGRLENRMVEEVMTTDDIAVAYPGDDVHDLMTLMKDRHVRRIPVVESGNTVVGIVAQADLAREVGPSEPDQIEALLEEISEPPLQVIT